MDLQAAATRAKEVAAGIGSTAARHDKEGTFNREAIEALSRAGLLGLVVPKQYGGAELGPRAYSAVVEELAAADASVAMVYVMHVCGSMCLLAGARSPRIQNILRDTAAGRHLTTLAFSEKGSRSHFWSPVSKAVRTPQGVRITALKSWVTSAGFANSYVTTTLAAEAKGPTDSTLYCVPADVPGCRVSAPWDGMGLRANASAPVVMEGVEVADELRLTEEGAGFKAKLEIVLPFFNLGSAAMSLGLCRGAVSTTIQHLKTNRFEHLNNVSLGEALPNLRSLLAEMQLATDGLAARVADTVDHLEKPGELTVLRVLESKAAAADTAIDVTGKAMHICGGAAFSRHSPVERIFRDAHASAVMAPTGDILKEFIGKALLGLPLF